MNRPIGGYTKFIVSSRCLNKCLRSLCLHLKPHDEEIPIILDGENVKIGDVVLNALNTGHPVTSSTVSALGRLNKICEIINEQPLVIEIRRTDWINIQEIIA